jgi:aromatic ring hydroxylase-like protein
VRYTDPRLLQLYAAPLVLIRPDQIVAWRGNRTNEANAVLRAVTGAT